MKSDDQTNIDKYRVAANITEYHFVSKLIFLRIIIPKCMTIGQLFHVKMSVKMTKNQRQMKQVSWGTFFQVFIIFF